MPIISAMVRTAKRKHRCADCRRMIEGDSRYMRLYGNADDGGKPYELKVHLGCVKDSRDRKVVAALNKKWTRLFTEDLEG